jgi:oxalate---CoA ligase
MMDLDRADDLQQAPASMMVLIAHRARIDPDAIALLAPRRPPLTFGMLIREVARALQSFAAMGFARGSRIGIALPNGPEMAVLLLAATDCAACAPLNPTSDEAQSRHLLQVLRVDALVVPTDEVSPLLRAASALGVPIIRLVFSSTDPAGVFDLFPPGSRVAATATLSTPEDVALLLHTSGTTALPRVATFTRRYLVELASARARLLRMTNSDRCLCVMPMFAAAGIRRNLFPTLAAGGSIVCPSGMDPAAFIGWLDAFRPTFYTGSPAIQRAVLDALERHGPPAHALRFVLSASGGLDAALQSRLEDALGVPVLQTYGTTEIGTIAQESLSRAQRRAGSVGVPADCEVAVLDATGAFLPPPGEGEIVVRGLHGFTGYDNDVEANRLAFHDGWYRTGDLGYLDSDGYLFLTGRVKEQINRGGFKISPSEVDAVLLSHPDVADAGTFGVEHPTLGEDVVAAVVPRHPSATSARQIRDYALSKLAAYKVPSRILVVTEIPKTVTGKVKRGEMAMKGGSSFRVDYVAPRGASEELTCRAFAEVLGLARVGAHDNFFELGGDSLRGAQVVARINAELGLDLSPVMLFRLPAACEFAAELDARASDPAVAPPMPIPRRARGGDSAR